MEWPPYSPDLNPIEHLWKRLKKNPQNFQPHIKSTSGGRPSVRAKLPEVLPLVWDTIESVYMKTLVERMPRRGTGCSEG